MLINIVNQNNKTEKEILGALEALGVEAEVPRTSLHLFFDEESDYRLENYMADLQDEGEYSEEIIDKLNSEEIYKSICSEISNRFMNSEFIFNYDLMDDIVRDEVEDTVKEILNSDKSEDIKADFSTVESELIEPNQFMEDNTLIDRALKAQNIKPKKYTNGTFEFSKDGVSIALYGDMINDLKKYSSHETGLDVECFFDRDDNNFACIWNNNYTLYLEICGESELDIRTLDELDLDDDKDIELVKRINPTYIGRHSNENAKLIARRLFEEFSSNEMARLVELEAISTVDLLNNWMSCSLYFTKQNGDDEFLDDTPTSFTYEDLINADKLVEIFNDEVKKHECVNKK